MTEIVYARTTATMNILKSRVECSHKLSTESRPISIGLFDELVPWINKMPTDTVNTEIVFNKPARCFTIKFSKK
jgi:hypothetical protein